MDPVSMGMGAAFELAKLIADEIAKATGADKAMTYDVAIKVAREWVASERRAVTDARAAAVARIDGDGDAEPDTDRPPFNPTEL